MPWKDSKSEELVLEEPDQIYRPAAGGRKGGLGIVGYAVLGVGILVLSGVILYVFLGQSMSEDSEQIRVLADRMAALENRISTLETTGREDDAAAQRMKRVTLFMDRFEKLEATSAARMSELAGRIEALEAGARTTRPAARPAEAAKPPAPAAGGAAGIHVVAKGDTLYSISRKYGLSVEDLLKRNGMAQGAVIYPGQKLTVGGP